MAATGFPVFKLCRICPNRKKGGPADGYYYDTVNGYTVAVECKCHQDWRHNYELFSKAVQSNVNSDIELTDYRGNESINSWAKLRKMADNPAECIKQQMFYIYGTNGCQKTTMAKAVGRSLIAAGYSVYMTTLSDIVKNLLNDYSEKREDIIAEKSTFVRKINEVDFLIIDEAFDRTKFYVSKSEYEIPFIDTFLRNRFERDHKSIMFISNKSPREIESQGFGPSIKNLVERNTVDTAWEFKDIYWKHGLNTKSFWGDDTDEQ